jgi:hypothetical protein
MNKGKKRVLIEVMKESFPLNFNGPFLPEKLSICRLPVKQRKLKGGCYGLEFRPQ